ncbi:unnamed protein product [Rotaria sp. Silwood2]|nr:unnamed protein product [Rotaria sp. Silwood2]CAF4665448.1 unnamed protein product [Rotaria sp. Silwood2]
MEHSCSEVDDLPDEILLNIFKELNNLEVLYSLTDVNKRINKIAHDPIFASHLSLLRHCSDHSIDPLNDSMLHRFCSRILPEIHYKIKWLNLESSSMERILLATNYPNLYGLGLYNLDKETIRCLFIDKTLLNHKFKNQISSLIVDIRENKARRTTDNIIKRVFIHILTTFTNLKYLNFGQSLRYERLSFYLSPPSVICSTLLELHVNLQYLADCLYLLDGRFDQLHTLNIHIPDIRRFDSSDSQIIKTINQVINI